VLADSRQSRELPFLATLLCLWGAGWVTSALTTLVFVGRAYPTSEPALMVGVDVLVSSVVGAVIVRYLLLNVLNLELSYSAILLALLAGSIADSVLRLALFAEFRHSGPAEAFPVAGLALSFVPSTVGALVSWWLLQNALRAQAPTMPVAVHLPEVAADRPNDPFGQSMAAARESALGLVAAVDIAEPASVPSLIADGMLALEAAAQRVEKTPPPGGVAPELPRRLAAATRELGDELAATADEAALTGTGGGRYRWELDNSPGVRAVRQALDELSALGY
jgi:hypothetical protein